MAATSTPIQTPDVLGRHVQFSLGKKRMQGTIVADRGPFGAGNKRIFTVHVPAEPFEPLSFELQEDEVTFVEPRPRALPSKEQITEFLKAGGLTLILRSNMSRDPSQPQVWLCLDSHNNVTFTFKPSVGGVGGGLVPRGALYEEWIFAPKRAEVVDFLQSFGLSKAEAEEIVNSIGTAPEIAEGQ